MQPTEIRKVLIEEGRRLSNEGGIVPAQCLVDYANLATDDELARLVELLTADEEPDVDAIIAEGERAVDQILDERERTGL